MISAGISGLLEHAAFFGATLLVALMRQGVNESVRAGAGIDTTLVLRQAGIRWKISLSEFRTPS